MSVPLFTAIHPIVASLKITNVNLMVALEERLCNFMGFILWECECLCQHYMALHPDISVLT